MEKASEVSEIWIDPVLAVLQKWVSKVFLLFHSKMWLTQECPQGAGMLPTVGLRCG